MNVMVLPSVITGLVPVIPMREALRSPDRDGRNKCGHGVRCLIGKVL